MLFDFIYKMIGQIVASKLFDIAGNLIVVEYYSRPYAKRGI